MREIWGLCFLFFSHFDYIERRTSDRQDVMVSHTLQEYPKELQKKVTLLQHFRSYLEGDSKIKPQNVKNYLEYVLIFIA